MRSTSGRSDEIRRMAPPRLRVNSTISRCTSSLAPTSMPCVGSSMIRMLERAISHLASTTFC